MKNILFLLLILTTSLFFQSCEDELKVEPEQSLSTDLAFSDESSAIASLMGVYSRGQSLYVFGSLPQIISDFQSDNVNFVGSFPTLREIDNYNVISSNSTIEAIWQDHYRVIFAANAVIKNAPTVADPAFSELEKKQTVAEAKFMRAITYFQLANLFSQPYIVSAGSNLAVPLVIEPFEGTSADPPRATLSAVHDLIIKDLQEAIPDLPDEYDEAIFTRGRATKGASRALLSRLYLYRGEWQKAADFADQVISSPLYELATDYSFYNANTKETVFAVQNSATDNGRTGSGFWSEYYNPSDLGGRGDCPFSQDLLDAFNAEAGDKRFEALTQTGKNTDAVLSTFTSKFPDFTTYSDNAPLIRTTEMYLNRAEALAQLNGVNQVSIDLINKLRTRAGLTSWTLGQFTSKQEFIDAILIERRKELCFEGHRRMDLLRNNKPLRTTGSGAGESSPGDNKVILPIPQRELDVNPNLTQNPGY